MWIFGWFSMSAVYALMFVAFLVVAIYTFARKPPDDEKPMPEFDRRFLAGYLLALAVLLVYVVFKLFLVDFHEAQANQPLAPPSLPARAASETKAEIVQIVPSGLSVDMGPVDLRIYGYNLPTNATAQVNGTPRTTRAISDQFLVVSLPMSDTNTPGSLSLTIPAQPNLQQTIPVEAPMGTLRLWTRSFLITREVQLLLLVVTAGALGSYIHAIRSLTDFIGNRTLVSSWFWFYVTKPFVGMAMALVFYAAIRGGFVAGSPADVKSVNPFGVFALAGMVGMFADKAGQKLADIFDALFKSADQRKDPLMPLEITTTALPGGKSGTNYPPVTLAAKGGTAPYKWSAAGLPANLVVDAGTGIISGIPAAAAASSVTVTVTDKSGDTKSRVLSLTIT